MSEPFVGQITLYPYSFAPMGWQDCAGQLLPLSQNTALFSLIGTYFGGDGKSNFALPDLRGRVAVGQGTLPGGQNYMIGEQGGAETVTLTTATMGTHTHSLNAVTSDGTTNAPAGALLATPAKGTLQGKDRGNIYNPAPPNTSLVAGAIGPAGNGQPHNNLQPMLVLRYCIALNGVFPSRP
jgi:microcystin-dependent protein